MLDVNAAISLARTKAKELKLDQFEGFISERETATSEKQADAITYAHHRQSGLGIRVHREGKVGFAATAVFTEPAILSCITEAVDRIELLYDSWEWRIPKTYASSPDLKLYDPGFSERLDLDPVEQFTAIEELTQQKLSGSDVNSRVWRRDQAEQITLFTLHSQLTHKSTLFQLGFEISLANKAAPLTVACTTHSRTVADLESLESLCRRTVARTWALRDYRAAPSRAYTLILESDLAAPTFIETAILSAIREHQSVWKQGTHVCSAAISLLDEPNLVGGICSTPVDDEGSLTEPLELIQAGILVNLPSVLLTPKNEPPTKGGQARRLSYAEPPSADTRQCRIPGGSLELVGLLETVKTGIYVLSFEPWLIDFENDAILALIHGQLIANGELTGSGTRLLLSDRLSRLLMSIDAVGSQLGRPYLSTNRAITCPAFRIADANMLYI